MSDRVMSDEAIPQCLDLLHSFVLEMKGGGEEGIVPKMQVL